MYYTQSLSFCQYSKYEYVTIKENFLESNMNYRSRIRDLREDKDLTQTEVGKILHKSQQGYSHIEAGRAELKIEDLAKLCKF